jgi:hypothetical protein
MRLDELTQPECGDLAENFRERAMQSRTTTLQVLVGGNPETDKTAAAQSPTTFGEHMQALDIVPGHSQMPQGISRQGNCQMRLCSEKHQADNHILSPMPTLVPDSSQIELAMPAQPGSFYPCIQHP